VLANVGDGVGASEAYLIVHHNGALLHTKGALSPAWCS
jgi:hypothetical protein